MVTLSREGSTLTHTSVHSAREKWVNNDVFYYASSHSAMSSVRHPEEMYLFIFTQINSSNPEFLIQCGCSVDEL